MRLRRSKPATTAATAGDESAEEADGISYGLDDEADTGISYGLADDENEDEGDDEADTGISYGLGDDEDEDEDADTDAEYEDDAEDEYDESEEYGEDADGEDEEGADNADAEYEDDAEDEDTDAEYDDDTEDEDTDAEYDDDDEDEYDEDEYDEDSDADTEDTDTGTTTAGKSFAPPTALSALRNSLRNPRQKAQPATGTKADEQRVNFLDKRERTIGYFLGVAMVALAIASYFHFRHIVYTTNIKVQNEVRHEAPWVLVITLALGLLILLATFFKRRAALGFTLLLAGVANFNGDLFIGIIYVGTGLWLVFRALRRSPKSRTAGAGARTGVGTRAGARGASTRAATTRAGSRTSATSSSATSATAGTATATGAGSRSRTTTAASSASGRTIGRNGRVSNAAVSGRYTPPKPSRYVPPAVQPEPEPSNRLASWLKK
jgi:hypothetical protein